MYLVLLAIRTEDSTASVYLNVYIHQLRFL